MVARGRSFAFEVIEDLELLVSYQGRSNPSDVEWASYLQVLERLHRGQTQYRYFTVSEGGHPSSTQQAQVKTVTHGRTPPVSIVSSSIAIRFMGSFLALFNHRVQCFGPEQMNRALEHVGVKAASQRRVRDCVAKLKAQVAGRTVAA
jgi:hypothetical protein